MLIHCMGATLILRKSIHNALRVSAYKVALDHARKKKVYTTTVETLLFFFWGLRSHAWCMPFFPDLGPMVYTLFLRFPRKMVYTIAFLAL